jgi:hypothetical protein
LPGPS